MQGEPGAEQAEMRHLFALLSEYLGAVPRQKEPNPPNLLTLFDKIDAQEKLMQHYLDDRLKHFLYQKSYRKAWLYMQGEETKH